MDEHYGEKNKTEKKNMKQAHGPNRLTVEIPTATNVCSPSLPAHQVFFSRLTTSVAKSSLGFAT